MILFLAPAALTYIILNTRRTRGDEPAEGSLALCYNAKSGDATVKPLIKRPEFQVVITRNFVTAHVF